MSDIKFCKGYKTDEGICRLHPRRRGLCDPCYQRWYRDEYPDKHEKWKANKAERRQQRERAKAEALAEKEGWPAVGRTCPTHSEGRTCPGLQTLEHARHVVTKGRLPPSVRGHGTCPSVGERDVLGHMC